MRSFCSLVEEWFDYGAEPVENGFSIGSSGLREEDQMTWGEVLIAGSEFEQILPLSDHFTSEDVADWMMFDAHLIFHVVQNPSGVFPTALMSITAISLVFDFCEVHLPR